MCGIAGVFAPRQADLSPDAMQRAVAAMTGAMQHRGPDADGLWADEGGRCVLGHRRLSIIDTSDAGVQPMPSGDGRHVVTFNGEIYNYLELRPRLEQAGVVFRGRTDTEVLIEALAHQGPSVLSSLDGMFAFAAFDRRDGAILLARDAFGEKPLYYTTLSSGAVAFASELQALERCPGFDARLDVSAMAEVLTFQYIGAPRCIYRSVRKLPPGHWLSIDAEGQIRSERFFSFRPGHDGYTDRPLPELVDQLEDILVRSIERRMIADVPLGAFLSGGVDSSTVCALIRRRLGRPLKTFSIGFQGAPESEHVTARAFAAHLGTEHHDEILDPDISAFLSGIGSRLDEPNADSSCMPTYLLSRFAREQVTVAISGDGGDEMFAGYGRYFATLDEAARGERGELGPGWSPGRAYFGDRILVGTESLIGELFGYVPDAFAEHLGRLRGELDASGGGLLAGMRRTDTDNYMPGAVLPKVDRMSMQCSLEVRTPFLNTELARFAERLPPSVLVDGPRGKLILREIAYRYLPRELIDLPKQGFALPVSDWARASTLQVAGRMLEAEDSRLRAIFGSEGIDRFLARQRSPGHFSPYQVWGVAMLESWLRHHPVVLPGRAALAFRSPSLEGNRSGTRSPPPAPVTSTPRRAALPVVPGVLIVAQTTVAPGSSVGSEEVLSLLPADLRILMLAHAAAATPAAARADGARLPVLELGEAGRPLRGATVFLHGVDANHMSPEEWDGMRREGMRHLLVRSSINWTVVYDFTFRQGGSAGHAAALVRLFRLRELALSDAGIFRRLGAEPFVPCGQGLRTFDRPLGTEVDQDRESSHRFSVFRGLRQLPPLERPMDQVRGAPDRYSIWNRRLFVGAPAGEPDTGAYWVVPNDLAEAEDLPIRRRDVVLPVFQASGAMPVVERALAPELGPSSLEPGDRVLVCTHGLPPGGAERQWVYLAQSLKARGFDVTFAVTDPLEDGNAYLQMLRRSAIPVLDGHSFGDLERLRMWPSDAIPLTDLTGLPDPYGMLVIASALLKVRPKAVFLQLDGPNTIGGIAAHVAGVPHVVLSFRNYNPSRFSYLANDWFRDVYRMLARSPRVVLTGNCIPANDDYADWIGIPRDRVAFIPNAIDAEHFTLPTPEDVDRTRGELGLDEGAPVVLGVFRLSEEKNPRLFVDVCARLLRSDPRCRVIVAGIGPALNQMIEWAEGLNVLDRITFLGRRSDTNVLMRLASVLLLTSDVEGMPNVLMEAQLMGTPVVATDAGGVLSVVEDGVAGFVRPAGDAAGLVAACETLLRDPPAARRMGEAGRTRMLAEFPKSELGRRYAALLQPAAGPAVAARVAVPA